MNCSSFFSFFLILIALGLECIGVGVPRIYTVGDFVQYGLLYANINGKIYSYSSNDGSMDGWFTCNILLIAVSLFCLFLALIFQIFGCYCSNNKAIRALIATLSMISIFSIVGALVLFHLGVSSLKNFKDIENFINTGSQTIATILGKGDFGTLHILNYGISFYLIATSIALSLVTTVLQFICINEKETLNINANTIPYMVMHHRDTRNSQQPLIE